MVTGVSPEQYREINEFGLSEQSRHWAAFGNAPMVWTTDGKESLGEPSLGMQHSKERLNIRANHQIVFHQMGPLVTGRRKHWRGKCDH